MQGADRVNDEFEVGFDSHFERRWRRAELIGHAVMALFLVAALAGLFGRGPLSHHTEGSAASGMSVDFEPFARSQTGTQVTLHLANTTQSPMLDVFIGGNSVEPMGLQRVVPEPVDRRAVDGGIVLSIAVPPGTRDGQVRLMLQPVSLGPNHLMATLAGHAPLRWTQFVAP